jgi:hypothetical protein
LLLVDPFLGSAHRAEFPLIAVFRFPGPPLTLVFLGLAFRRLYLQPQVCEPGAACVEPMVQNRQRLIFWVVTVALLALLSVPWLAPFFL